MRSTELLPGLAVAEDQEVRLGVRVERDRRELLLVDADEQEQGRVELGVLAWLADRVEPDLVRAAAAASGPCGPRQAAVTAADEVVDALAEAAPGRPCRRSAGGRPGSAAWTA